MVKWMDVYLLLNAARFGWRRVGCIDPDICLVSVEVLEINCASK